MQASTSPSWSRSAILMVAGGALTAIGCFLNFATVDVEAEQFNVSESQSVGGMDTSDGKIFLVAGLILLGLGIISRTKPDLKKILAIIGVLVALFVVGFAIKDIADVDGIADSDELAQATEGFDLEELGITVEASTGMGLYLVLLGGLAGGAGAVMLLMEKDEGQASFSTPAEPPPAQPPGV